LAAIIEQAAPRASVHPSKFHFKLGQFAIFKQTLINIVRVTKNILKILYNAIKQLIKSCSEQF